MKKIIVEYAPAAGMAILTLAVLNLTSRHLPANKPLLKPCMEMAVRYPTWGEVQQIFKHHNPNESVGAGGMLFSLTPVKMEIFYRTECRDDFHVIGEKAR